MTSVIVAVDTTTRYTEDAVASWQKDKGRFPWFLSVDVDTLTNIVTVVENPGYTGEPKTHALTPYLFKRGIERVIVYDTEHPDTGRVVTSTLQRLIVQSAEANKGRVNSEVADCILQVACWGHRKFES